MKSSGRPNVSYSLNASSPGSSRPGDAAARSIASSSLGKPPARTALKRSSSLRDDADDRVAVRSQLGIGVAHLADDDVDELVQERLGDAELHAVAHRAAHDLAQHVAAELVRRDHAVGDKERHRRASDRPRRASTHRPGSSSGRTFLPASCADCIEDGREQVGVVVRLVTLQDGA